MTLTPGEIEKEAQQAAEAIMDALNSGRMQSITECYAYPDEPYSSHQRYLAKVGDLQMQGYDDTSFKLMKRIMSILVERGFDPFKDEWIVHTKH